MPQGTKRPKTKRPQTQCPKDKTSQGKKRPKDKMSQGQNVLRDKTSQGTKRPTLNTKFSKTHFVLENWPHMLVMYSARCRRPWGTSQTDPR